MLMCGKNRKMLINVNDFKKKFLTTLKEFFSFSKNINFAKNLKSESNYPITRQEVHQVYSKSTN